MQLDEIVKLSKIFVDLGVNKIRLTVGNAGEERCGCDHPGFIKTAVKLT